MFSPLNKIFIFVRIDCSLDNMTLYCLNPNLVINLCAAVVLQSTITLVAISLYIKVLLSLFLFHLLVHIYVFYGLKYILL